MRNIIRRFRIKNRRRKNPLIEPDEIFLDSKNLPEFDVQQFEGTLGLPISRQTLMSVAVIFAFFLIIFVSRLWYLQVRNGEVYKRQSEKNSLSREPIFAARGNIYDRNGIQLAWNNTKTDDMPWGKREYIDAPGFGNILGYVSYPAKDSSGNYWQTEIVGRDGVEKSYNDALEGINGSTIVERDIAGRLQGGAIVDEPNNGKNLDLTIDSHLQTELQQDFVAGASKYGFRSVSGVLLDVRNGEIIAMTNVPDYSSNIMTEGKDKKTIQNYLTSSLTPLLNRAVSGLYTPGSTVKPYLAMGALNEGVIDPLKKIAAHGYITVENPYDPAHPSIFRDYEPDNGLVDMRHALAVSSNIYFMEVGGGYHDQKGIGIYNIDKYFSMFGLDSKTGVDLPSEKKGNLPSPEWKSSHFDGEIWRIGDTYNSAIGQYGVQFTPIELARAVSAIANRGTLVTPHVVITDQKLPETKLPFPDSYYTVVHEGMRLGAQVGTAYNLARLPFAVASKSGTAQVGPGGAMVNSWMTGFFPYENPHYAFAVVFERGPTTGLGSSQVMVEHFLKWVYLNYPEYTK